MIKKLDKLIIKAFLGPFIITFFIAFFVLMMQSLWKYIDDLVGKGLDMITVLQFVWYASASLLVLAMPIAILISSIMTFGNLGEHFELVAIKSSGISLLRIMRPLVLVCVFFCGLTFLFANYVIPVANLKFVTLYSDIYLKKPAFDLKEGVFFTHIPNYAIKVGKKEEDGKTIRQVLIYDQSNPLQDNCITAEKGVMRLSDDEKYLEFNLTNGYRYQERGAATDSSTEFTRVHFTSFKKLLDLSALQKQNTSDSLFRNNFKMLSARQLDKNIDSIKNVDGQLEKKLLDLMRVSLRYSQLPQKTWDKTIGVPNSYINAPLIPDSVKIRMKQLYGNRLTELRNSVQQVMLEKEAKQKELKFHKIEWHRKFSISLACLILFFIGAPLGAIIRKGGLGLPLVVAIVFFLLFHLLNMFGEKFAREEILSPAWGMWLAIIGLIPVGFFLTYKSMHDSQLFNLEFYSRLFTLFSRRKSNSPQIPAHETINEQP
jgi:lipopolysaccharide export system permease protein